MTKVRVADDLWATSMLPEGVLERWLVADGAAVEAAQALAAIRVEDVLHEIPAPASGLVAILSNANCIIEPGALLARIAA
jgi:pyruvate/2-oxoglutarate dehydrogenase complex dihydrolipoamide acyltransferase (E2) component